MTPTTPRLLLSDSYNPLAPVTFGYIFSIIGFSILFSIFGSFLVAMITRSPLDPVAQLAWQQAIGTLFTFLLPAYLVEYYFRRKNYTHLYRWRSATMPRRQILPAFSLLLCLLPAVYGLTYLSEHYLDLNSLLPFSDRFRTIEEQSNQALATILSDRSFRGVTRSILIIAVLTPIAEELIMRGALQGWILAKTHRLHLSVWIVALIFSLIHLQADGFLGRLLLGAALGYIAAYGSLWLAMLIHGVNNLLAYFEYLSTGDVNSSRAFFTDGFGLMSTLFVIVGSALAILIVSRMRQNLAKALL